MFSIVIPLYNKEKSIFDTLSSVLSQTHSDFEVIVVDDGSTDSSANIVQGISDSRVRLIRQKNKGVCAARNRGIEEAAFDYIAFLDADDIWNPNYLAQQKQMIERYPDARMWGMNFAEIDKMGEKHLLSTGLPEDFCGIVHNYFEFHHVSDLFTSSSVVIKKDTFNRVGVFDERIKYSEDLDMWYRIILNYPVAFSSRVLVYYMLNAENRAMKKTISLDSFLPFYIEKYGMYCDNNKVFSHFINTFSAAKILNYYFGGKEDRKKAKKVIQKIRFSDIHPKYWILYKTPFCIGRIFLQILKLRHRK